jgi:HD-GYP domain-containing protein (c-di-GMP phosphodiesterase class II)
MEEIRDFSSLINRLNCVGIALSSEHNLSRLLDMIVSELRDFTRSEGGSLYIKKGDELSFEVAQNEILIKRFGSVPFKTFRIPIDHNSISGYVASTGSLINIPNLESAGDDLPFSLQTTHDFDKKNGLKTVSMLVVPMKNHKDEIIGVVQLMNSRDERGNLIPYDLWTQELVSSLASQAAVAISNSVLIQNIKNLFEGLVTYSVQAIDARSPHTAGHSMRVSKLVMRQVESINKCTKGAFADIYFSEEEIDELRMAAWLHDIGKIGVREYVLDKKNKLSDETVKGIVTRFNYIRKECENHANQLKLELLSSEDNTLEKREMIDNNVKKEIEEITYDLGLILKMNKPGFYSEDEYANLNKIGTKKYHDIEGAECLFLEPSELENISVRKGNLTDRERSEIESHVHHTLNILEKLPFTEELSEIPHFAAAHHEMLNGTGYPKGLKNEEIPLQSRIIAVADIFEALTARDRPYKPPIPLEKALVILRDEAVSGRLDPEVVELFIADEIYKSV